MCKSYSELACTIVQGNEYWIICEYGLTKYATYRAIDGALNVHRFIKLHKKNLEYLGEKNSIKLAIEALN